MQKYHGAGNSFVVLDRRHRPLPSPQEIVKICTEQQTDGLLVLKESEKYAYQMHYFNRDGSFDFCGNGARVLAFFAHELGVLNSDQTDVFEATDGLHAVRFDGKEWGIQMRSVLFTDISAVLHGYFLDTGVLHYVEETAQLDEIDINKKAPPIRHHVLFPKGINVNFYQILDPRTLVLRTYERGVEAETLACGTGATAVGLTVALLKNFTSPIILQAKGGKLTLYFEKRKDRFENIWLFGPVEKL